MGADMVGATAAMTEDYGDENTGTHFEIGEVDR